LLKEIEEMLDSIEPLASFIPAPVLNLLVESAAQRRIPPDFPEPTVMFVNFIGLPELVDRALPGEELKVVNSFSRAFALINAAVEARGGVLKKVTYHLSGSDIVIYFGAPTGHTNDPTRAVEAALAIREIIRGIKPPTVGGVLPEVTCQIGINLGPTFVAEIGEPRGRREFNVLGDTVNTTARLMNKAGKDQIFISGKVQAAVDSRCKTKSLGTMALKGKSGEMPVFELLGAENNM
jgi:class 3 adenylate cyclase